MNRTRTVVALGLFAGVWLVLTACGSSDAFLSGGSGGPVTLSCQICAEFCCSNPYIKNCCPVSLCVASNTDCNDEDMPPDDGTEVEEAGAGDDSGGGDDGGGGISDGGGGGGGGGSVCTTPPPGGGGG
jgi:hypothetical protein